ncbi:diphthine--ammonia ligase [uncultured Dokdonia sp.]|uniref:Dph6-related ATP pyrophosphatase n=1 Tax=uncultured Dokdonia sp. TaxID=575653 RepID=UPI002625C247|nr:diphthine--ammonia ligase [uncultured Dokdonia sp.]
MYKTYFNWSSGKDSSLALYKILQDPTYEISTFITTVNSDYNRVSMHGLRIALLEQQVQSLGFSLHQIEFPAQVTMEAYSDKMRSEVTRLKEDGYTHGVFGDIFLEDLRAYRDKQLAGVGIKGVYPLWKKDTKTLLKEFIAAGFKAITVCVNATYLDEHFCGRVIDESFIEDLPETVDVCGENGEFHTFVYDGPLFKNPIPFTIGEKVLRGYNRSDNDADNCFTDEEDQRSWDTAFWYCDLLPK